MTQKAFSSTLIQSQLKTNRTKTMTNTSFEFLDLNKVRLRFLKEKSQDDSAPPSDRGILLKTQMESVQSAASSSGVKSISATEALTVSYSIGYSSGVASQGQRPNTTVAIELSDNEDKSPGYGTPGDYDTSTCFTSRHPTRCSTAWSLTSGRRTTSVKQPCIKTSAGGDGSREPVSGNDGRGTESGRSQRTCSNELMNVITIDDGVVVVTQSDDVEPCNDCDRNEVVEIQMNTEQRLAGRNFVSTKAAKRTGRVDTRRPIRSRDDMLRLIERAMSLTISGSRR